MASTVHDPYGRYYLHYWYGDYPYANTVTALINQNKADTYKAQLLAFQQRQAKLKSSFDDSVVEGWSKLFDETYYRKSFSDVFSPSGADVDNSNVTSSASLEESIARLNGFNLTNTVDSIQSFCTLLSDVLMPLIMGGDKTEFEAYKTALLNYYATIDSNHNQSKFAQQALRGIVSKYESKFIEIPDATGAYSTLKDYEKRLMAYLVNMESLASSIGDAPLTIERKSGTQELSDGAAILNRIRESVIKSIQNVSKHMSEVAVALAANNASKEFFDRLDEVNNVSFNRATVTGSKSLGTLGIDCTVQMTPDSTQQAMKEAIDSVVRINQKYSKSDVTMTVSKDGVTANIGFVVKDIGNLDFSKNLSGKTIKLQEGTPLYTLLVRELGFSSTQMQGVIQLAVGHASDSQGKYGEKYSSSQLTSMWDSLMEQVKDRALLTALTGLEAEGATFLVLNGSVIPMVSVVESIVDYVSGGGDALSLSGARDKGATASNNAGLKRSTYLNMNTWKGTWGRKNPTNAQKRSEALFSAVSNKFYDTKVRIDLNLGSIQSIMRTI